MREVPQSGPGVRLKYFCLNTAIFTSQAVFLQNERLSSTKGIYGSPVLQSIMQKVARACSAVPLSHPHNCNKSCADACNKTKLSDNCKFVLLQFSCSCVDANNQRAYNRTFYFYCSCAGGFKSTRFILSTFSTLCGHSSGGFYGLLTCLEHSPQRFIFAKPFVGMSIYSYSNPSTQNPRQPTGQLSRAADTRCSLAVL